MPAQSTIMDTRQKPIQLHLPNLAPPPSRDPQYNVSNQYFQFHLIFKVVLGVEGGDNVILKG